MINQESPQDPWAQMRNVIGLMLIFIGAAGMCVVFFELFNLVRGIGSEHAFVLKIEKLIASKVRSILFNKTLAKRSFDSCVQPATCGETMTLSYLKSSAYKSRSPSV